MNSHKRAFVLLSGGVDSTTCLFLALEHMKKVDGKVVAFSVDYGQRHNKEIECAYNICEELNIEHRTLNLRGFATGMLTDPNISVPNISYDEIQGISPTYVPFRNGAMLSMLAAQAQQYVAVVESDHCDAMNQRGDTAPIDTRDLVEDLVWLYFGAHAEDAANWAYPDCTPEFVGAMANAIYIGTYKSVRLLTPFVHSSKAEIIRKGTELDVPYEMTWSCYKGEEKHCGVCPTCRARRQAFKDAGILDPTTYAA